MKITEEVFTQAMRDAVAERGDGFIYPKGAPGWARWGSMSCRYVRTDASEPACLIGAALHKCGVSLGALVRMEGTAAVNLDLDLPAKVRNAAQRAQTVQDDGGTWGLALIEYLTALEWAGA